MIEKQVLSWIEANHVMDDEFRRQVITDALSQFPHATPELRRFALEVLKKIQVNGFRPFPNIRHNKFMPILTSEFKSDNSATTVIVCLWAEKQHEIIGILQRAALDAGIHIHKKWNWQEARRGFVGFDDIPELMALATKLAEEFPKQKSDEYLLAALWLSNSLFLEETQRPVVEYDYDDENSNLADEVTAHNTNEPIENSKQDASELPTVETVLPEVEISTVVLDIAHLDQKTTKELSQYWESQSAEIIGARDSFLAKIDDLRAAALSDEPTEAMEKLKQLEADRREWAVLKRQSDELVDYIHARVIRELQLRPDIKEIQPEVSVLSTDPTEGELVAILPTVFQAIASYDAKKTALLIDLSNLRNELLALEQSLSLWQNDVTSIQHQLQQVNDPQDLTVQQLQAHFENTRKVALEGKEKRLQARQISISRILDTANKISEVSNDETVQIGEYELSQLSESRLQNISGSELQGIEIGILAIFNGLVVEAKTGNSYKLAAELKTNWGEQTLSQLLQSLAKENRNLEAILLEMASSTVHAHAIPSAYSREIAKSFLRGLSELSTETNPYLLLNQLASNFFLGWSGIDSVTRLERCILALAAQAVNESDLPQGFLWQIEFEWPEASWESWGRLWQSVLLEEEIQIYTDQKIAEMKDDLDLKRKNIELLFTKDHGHYIRLSSIRSDRHRSMMTNHVMPYFQEHFAKLSDFRKRLESVSVEKHIIFLKDLENHLDALEKSLTERKLEELYQKGIHEANVDDDQPFHIRVCSRIIAEAATEIIDYCKSLKELETLRSVRRDGHNYHNLMGELNEYTDSSPLVLPALDQIIKGSLSLRVGPSDNGNLGTQKVLEKLLSNATWVNRIPQTISLLVNHPFSWEGVLQALLEDIETPHEMSSASTVLLDNNVTTQVLLVVKQLPLEIQKLAQSKHRDQEKRIKELETEYNKLGGESEWTNLDHDLGRWGYLATLLIDNITKQKRISEEERHAFEIQAFTFRERINKLDIEIFKSRSNIPVDVIPTLENGLNIARKASKLARLFSQLAEYLDEIEYRLTRDAWIASAIEMSTQELEKSLLGIEAKSDSLSNASEIIQLLELGELSKLGLNSEDIDESRISTRIKVLDNWIAVKNLSTINSERLNRIQIERIKELFGFFGRMIAMNRSRGTDNSYMSYDYPVVHEYWKLRYPRTTALDLQCIMVALPGDPPNSTDLQMLDEYLEKEQVLAVHFVFLFVPGCTEKIAKRLKQNYSKQGLVLIDEMALIKMVLAERETAMIPLGKLRPMMLNSTGANADIFTVNQSVSARTSLFFGRDTLIEKIASSGDNYAIYGGRRIGKSSALRGIEQLLEHRGQHVVSYSLEGELTYSEEHIASKLAKLLGVKREYEESRDLKMALFNHFESNPEKSIVLILDEIDSYIQANRQRHTLIEALRATSIKFEGRFRVIIAGFMELYDCMKGQGPYTSTSDPWGRMLNDIGPLDNLKPSDAEKIVQEGFLSILGWQFEHRTIPRKVVERTGGHPAFVQYFCLKLQDQISKRGDQLITLNDVDAVFDDDTPGSSFIGYVRRTLQMNLSDSLYSRHRIGKKVSDPVSRYLLLWLALESSDRQTFTMDQLKEIANSSKTPIPEPILERSIDLLTVTSVVREIATHLYEFTVPDYPLILNRLDEGANLESLEQELKLFLETEQING